MPTATAGQTDKSLEIFDLINIKKGINFTYTWVLPRHIPENYHSEIFSNEADEVKWQLNLQKTFSSLEVRLCFTSSDVVKITCNCKFTISSQRPILLERNSIKHYAESIVFTHKKFLSCLTQDFNVLKQLHPEGSKINCAIHVVEISTKLTIPKCTPTDTLTYMFENKIFCDVKFCVSGQEFQAHKAILAAQSPVFNAMFMHEMKEKKNNRVDITDIDAEVFEELLRFVYTGNVSNLEKYASELLSAAEKYEFQNLKVLCGRQLYYNISIETAAEVLVLMDMYNLDQFKAAVIGYVGTYAEDICRTDGWLSLQQSHQHLITEVLCDVSKQLHNKIAYDRSFKNFLPDL